jgi:predicted DNA-binding antitoxin AbrB/MazE fold protein
MSVEVEATYDGGVLKLDHPLPLADKQRIRITVHLPVSRARESAGLLQWKGTAEDLEYLAESPDNSPWDRS